MKQMRPLVLTVLLVVVAVPAAAETAAQVFQKASPSIVVVMTYNAAGKATELGSGVVLPDSSVATNCHVLKDGTQYRVRYQGKDYPAQLRNSDWNRDVCSLTVAGLHAPPVVLGNTKTLEVGAQAYAIGAPEGLQLTLSDGIVSSLRPVEGGSYIQTTAAISPGSSGGGLFDDQGRLLGLTSFYVSEGQQLNFALPVEWIEALPQHSSQRVAGVTSEVDWLKRAAPLETKKDWRGLKALAERWIKASPRSGGAWAVLGEAYENMGDYTDAIDAYRQTLQIDPQLNFWNNLGIAYNGAGKHEQAIDAYRQALRINPQNVKAWNNLGIAYDDAGKQAQAIDAFRQMLRTNPQLAEAWNGLGNAYDDAGQHGQAIDAYRQALRINPQDAKTWYNLGRAYYGAGKDEQAIDAIRQALRINPQLAVAWHNLGVAYAKVANYAQAIDAYRQALRINPQLPEAWQNLGVAYTEVANYPQAIDAFREALRINPQDAKAWLDLGLAYVLVGQKDQALAVYQHLKTLSPELASKLFDAIVP